MEWIFRAHSRFRIRELTMPVWLSLLQEARSAEATLQEAKDEAAALQERCTRAERHAQATAAGKHSKDLHRSLWTACFGFQELLRYVQILSSPESAMVFFNAFHLQQAKCLVTASIPWTWGHKPRCKVNCILGCQLKEGCHVACRSCRGSCQGSRCRDGPAAGEGECPGSTSCTPA